MPDRRARRRRGSSVSPTGASRIRCAAIRSRMRSRVVPLQPLRALHDHLRREDRPALRRLGVGPLPLGVARARRSCRSSRDSPSSRRAAPARSPPRPGELGQQRVGRRAGRAALAGEELEHHRRRLRPPAVRQESAASGGQDQAGGAWRTFGMTVRHRLDAAREPAPVKPSRAQRLTSAASPRDSAPPRRRTGGATPPPRRRTNRARRRQERPAPAPAPRRRRAGSAQPSRISVMPV